MDKEAIQTMIDALMAADSEEDRMFVVANSLGWDVNTDFQGGYVLYPGVTDPEWQDDNEEDEDE